MVAADYSGFPSRENSLELVHPLRPDGSTRGPSARSKDKKEAHPLTQSRRRVRGPVLPWTARIGTSLRAGFLALAAAGACQPGLEAAAQSGPQSFDFRQLATGHRHRNVLKLFNPAIDPARRRLYVVGSLTTQVAVIDIDRDELLESFDMGAPGGFLVFDAGALYSYDFAAGRCHRIDPDQRLAAEVPLGTCVGLAPRDRGQPKQWGGYSFLETGYRSFPDGTSGFPVDWRQDQNAAYGVIEVRDASGAKRGEIVHGPDALYFAIDEATGKLYTTNTGDGSVSVFDLKRLASTDYCRDNACKLTDIDLGDSVDQVVAGAAGRLYVRNRLGGSVLYRYDPSSGALLVLENENHTAGGIGLWPTAMALDQTRGRLYLLSHYAARIDVIDTAAGRVMGRIPFDTSLKPRTDSISTMTLDPGRGRLYAAWPELGLLGVADAVSGRPLATVELAQLGFEKGKAANAGPGVVNLAVNTKTRTLYVSWSFRQERQSRLLALDADTLALLRDVSVAGAPGEGGLLSNDEKDVLYFGNLVLHGSTLATIDSLPFEGKVGGFDNLRDAVYLGELSGNAATGRRFTVYELVGRTRTRQWNIDGVGSIVNAFFDIEGRAFYVADFVSGVVTRHPL